MENSAEKRRLLSEVLMVLQDTSYWKLTGASSSSSSDSEEEITPLHRVIDYYEKTVQAYTDDEFKSNFRLEKSSFNNLMEFLLPILIQIGTTHTGGRQAIPAEKKVLMTIYYLSNQDSFRQVANLFNVSDSTAHTIINNIIDLLYTHSPKFIKWLTEEQANVNEHLFFNKGGLRNVLGCIDGSHITIPNVGKDNDYINRKGYSSILLQGVVNYNMEFIDVYCGEPGSMQDSRLLRKSGLYQAVRENPSCMYGYFLLGDSAYMCQDWLVPPFKDNGALTSEQLRFNYIHSSLRVKVENAFGMLKGRFRRLREFQNVSRSFIIKATVSAIVLHNICMATHDEIEFPNENENQAHHIETAEDTSTATNRRLQAFFQLFPNSN